MAFYFRDPIDPIEARTNIQSALTNWPHFEGLCSVCEDNALRAEQDLSDADRNEAIATLKLLDIKPVWVCYSLARLHADYVDTLRDAVAYVRAWGDFSKATRLTNVLFAINDDRTQHAYIWIGFDSEADKAKFIETGENKDIVI